MKEYNDGWALEQQVLAFEGDEQACWRLISLAKPPLLSMLADSRVEKCEWDCVWSNVIVRLTQIIASGNRISKWLAFCRSVCNGKITDNVRKAESRARAEEEHLVRVRERYSQAYPAINECVETLMLDEQDLVYSVYWSRLSILKYADTIQRNYYWVWRWHKRILNQLKGMMEERGIRRA